MNHNEAIDTHAAERYLLGELGEQRDAFEEHFFDCALCAADMKDGAALVAGVRAAAREDPFPVLAHQSAWWAPSRFVTPAFAAAAASVFVVLLGSQQVVIMGLRHDLDRERAPRTVAVYSLRDVRAERQTVVNAGAPFTLDFDIPAEPPSPSYTCSIEDAGGKTRMSIPISAAEARDTIHLNLHASALGPGDYKLQITGSGGAAVATYDFTIR